MIFILVLLGKQLCLREENNKKKKGKQFFPKTKTRLYKSLILILEKLNQYKLILSNEDVYLFFSL